MQHTAKNQAEPEPFAWLNEGQEATLDEGCKVLTQFKTVESDDSEKDDQGVIGKIRCLKFLKSNPDFKVKVIIDQEPARFQLHYCVRKV